MGKTHSEDLRERVYGEIERGASRRSAARRFGVSVSTSIRLARRMEQKGSLAPERQGRPAGSGRLAAYHDQLIRWAEKQPDITMPEPAALLPKERQVTAHLASLARILRELGFTFKKRCWPPKPGAMMSQRRAGASVWIACPNARATPSPDLRR